MIMPAAPGGMAEHVFRCAEGFGHDCHGVPDHLPFAPGQRLDDRCGAGAVHHEAGTAEEGTMSMTVPFGSADENIGRGGPAVREPDLDLAVVRTLGWGRGGRGTYSARGRPRCPGCLSFSPTTGEAAGRGTVLASVR
jgi:hypothetical protein